MTEPQVWVLIGVFAAAIFGMFTIVSTLFLRILRAEVGSIRGEIGTLRAEMNGRFDKLDQRVDGIHRDVQALVKHTFGLDRG